MFWKLYFKRLILRFRNRRLHLFHFIETYLIHIRIYFAFSFDINYEVSSNIGLAFYFYWTSHLFYYLLTYRQSKSSSNLISLCFIIQLTKIDKQIWDIFLFNPNTSISYNDLQMNEFVCLIIRQTIQIFIKRIFFDNVDDILIVMQWINILHNYPFHLFSIVLRAYILRTQNFYYYSDLTTDICKFYRIANKIQNHLIISSFITKNAIDQIKIWFWINDCLKINSALFSTPMNYSKRILYYLS